jgi:RNA polymerase sigma-70 factor (ECF subfamily)
MSGVSSRDQQWLADLYSGCAPDLARFFLRRGVSGEEAADLVADVFVVALRRHADMPEGEESRPWLYGVAARLLLAHQRRERLDPVGAEDVETAADARGRTSCGEPPESSRDEPSLRTAETVQESIHRLPYLDRELLLLTVWEGLTTADAARALGLTPGAARVRLHRVRERLSNDASLRGLVDGDPSPSLGSDVATSLR